jgi:hypothetical protein
MEKLRGGKMQNCDWSWKISKMNELLVNMHDDVKELKALVKPEQELWDNADIIRYWKVSGRTLAEWRAKGLIGFVQVGNKIWYPRIARELFINKHFNKPKSEEETDGEEG